MFSSQESFFINRKCFNLKKKKRLHGFVSTLKQSWRSRIKSSQRIIEYQSPTPRRRSGSWEFVTWRRQTKAGTCARWDLCQQFSIFPETFPHPRSTPTQWSPKWATSMLSVNCEASNNFSIFWSSTFYALSVAWHPRRPNKSRHNCSGVWKRDIVVQSHWITRWVKH